MGTGSYQDSYQYNNNNGTLSSMTSGVGKTLTLGYDALLRPQSRAVSGVYQKRQNYTNFGTDRQSGQLNYLNYFKADGTTPKLGYRYLYDAGGNIKEVKSKTGSNALATESTFQYDKLGQLTKVTGKTNETYTYDTAGNMLSRTKGSTTTSYLYENAAWGDLLTSYKGQKLAYEGQTYVSSTSVTGTPKSGNPISYYNGTRWTMGWQGANQLISASSSGKSLSFTYDVNGLRTSKTYNGTKYQYAYAGDRLLWQGWSGNEMFFFYDEQGAPFAFRHVSSSGTVTVGYYFLNGQGDVVQIENASGTVLATYSYDPWGKPISSTGTFASINPLRYRGYYYDTETGFYYLQNRYYDPTISRFINADSYAATGGLLGYNMFAYCGNNPVNRIDPTGHSFLTALLATAVVVILAVQIACTVKEEERVKNELDSLPKPTKDISVSFRNTLKSNARTVKNTTKEKGIIKSGIEFYNKVRNGGQWDLKQFPEYQGTFKFNEITIQGQDIGNINFGYTGKALGLPDSVLLTGAGVAQIMAGTSNFSFFMASNGDDPRDQMYIMYGIMLYNEDN